MKYGRGQCNLFEYFLLLFLIDKWPCFYYSLTVSLTALGQNGWEMMNVKGNFLWRKVTLATVKGCAVTTSCLVTERTISRNYIYYE